LVKMVRYQGRLKRSPYDMPTFTGREVSSSGGNFSGASLSRNSPSKRFHRGVFQLLASKSWTSDSSAVLCEAVLISSDSGLLGSENKVHPVTPVLQLRFLFSVTEFDIELRKKGLPSHGPSVRMKLCMAGP